MVQNEVSTWTPNYCPPDSTRLTSPITWSTGCVITGANFNGLISLVVILQVDKFSCYTWLYFQCEQYAVFCIIFDVNERNAFSN